MEHHDHQLPPSPALLVTTALAAHTGDSDGAVQMLTEAGFYDRPATVAIAYLHLTSQLAGYYGGAMYGAPRPGTEAPEDFRALLRVVDAVWGEGPSQGAKLLAETIAAARDQAHADAMMGWLITFGAESLLSVYRGTVQPHDPMDQLRG